MAAEQLENIQEKMNWHWRNSMRVVRFLNFDARAAFPIPILLVYARTSTFILLVVTLMLFRYLENKGLTVPAAMRSLRMNLVGIERPGWLSSQRRRFIDYG